MAASRLAGRRHAAPHDGRHASGGVVRPLVANIARDGRAQRRGKGFRVARYTEDIGVMAKSLPAIEPACPVVPAFLTEQGLALHPEKTRIVPRTAGFDVLGFHGQMRGQKRLITPPNQKGQALLQASRAWLKTHATATAAGVMHHRTPRLRGGALYYRHVVSKHTVQQVDYHIGRALGRGVKRRHPPKPKRWLYRRDVEVGKYGATFSTASRERRGQTRRLRRERRPTLPIVCHVQVKGRAPPDEPSLNADGESRRLKRGRQRVAKGSLLYGIAEAPRWPCPGGGQALFDGQEVHLPHRLPVKAGGRDDRQHRHGLHAPCHRPRHRPGVTAGHSA